MQERRDRGRTSIKTKPPRDKVTLSHLQAQSEAPVAWISALAMRHRRSNCFSAVYEMKMYVGSTPEPPWLSIHVCGSRHPLGLSGVCASRKHRSRGRRHRSARRMSFVVDADDDEPAPTPPPPPPLVCLMGALAPLGFSPRFSWKFRALFGYVQLRYGTGS